jgi:tripartite-type tricarboxylate transporter receptor subunit TctC
VKSFTHIAYIGTTYLAVITNLSVPATDLKSLMAWMKSQPQPVIYGSSGIGSVGHVVGNMFTAQTGIPLNHAPYKEMAAMHGDLLSGSILLTFDTLPQNLENLRAGRLRAYAVTAEARAPTLPTIPTVVEGGLPALLAENWLGLSGPAGLPPEVVARLNAEVAAALKTPAMLERLGTVGIIPGEKTQAEFAAFVARDVEVMGGAVRAMGIKND